MRLYNSCLSDAALTLLVDYVNAAPAISCRRVRPRLMMDAWGRSGRWPPMSTWTVKALLLSWRRRDCGVVHGGHVVSLLHGHWYA